jgi:spermidine synthase
MKEALADGGIILAQGECQWLHADLITSMQQFCQKLFKNTKYGYTTIPTYPSGQIGFIVCSDVSPISKPVRELPEEITDSFNYYTP